MLYTLNNNYVLRQELNDCYRLYNKKTLRSYTICLLYTSPSPRDSTSSRMPSSA